MVPNALQRLMPRMPKDNCSSWLMALGFCLLIFVSVIVTFVSDADVAQVASLYAANILLLTLFWWLPSIGQAAPPPTFAKFVVGLISTSIVAVLTWYMTREAPLLAKAILWVLIAVTSLSTSYYFCHKASDHNMRPWNVCLCFFLIFVLFNFFAVTYIRYETNILTDRINSVIFELSSSLASMLLLWCITAMVITPHNTAIREWMKFCAWAFATVLALMVGSKVAEIFPWPMKYVAWAMVGASSFSCLHAFFFQREAYIVTIAV